MSVPFDPPVNPEVRQARSRIMAENWVWDPIVRRWYLESTLIKQDLEEYVRQLDALLAKDFR